MGEGGGGARRAPRGGGSGGAAGRRGAGPPRNAAARPPRPAPPRAPPRRAVRTNLDPTGALPARGVGDAAVWSLLGEVGLAAIVRGLGGLDAPLPTGGAALSLGQRQVFSLIRRARKRGSAEARKRGSAEARKRGSAEARAAAAPAAAGRAPTPAQQLWAAPARAPRPRPAPRARAPPPARRAVLRGAHVLAIDEGTANLDAATDATIQATLDRLRRPAAGGGGGGCGGLAPAGCSLIVVAHRLESVPATDNLLVMSQGRVLEAGPPAALAALPRGVYAAMLRAMADARAAAAAAAAAVEAP